MPRLKKSFFSWLMSEEITRKCFTLYELLSYDQFSIFFFFFFFYYYDFSFWNLNCGNFWHNLILGRPFCNSLFIFLYVKHFGNRYCFQIFLAVCNTSLTQYIMTFSQSNTKDLPLVCISIDFLLHFTSYCCPYIFWAANIFLKKCVSEVLIFLK